MANVEGERWRAVERVWIKRGWNQGACALWETMMTRAWKVLPVVLRALMCTVQPEVEKAGTGRIIRYLESFLSLTACCKTMWLWLAAPDLE